MIIRLKKFILDHTVPAKRDASEEEIFVPPFDAHMSASASAKLYRWPYAHIVIDDFLKPAAAEAAAAYITKLLEEKDAQFTRRKLYDIYAHRITPEEEGSLSFLFDLRFKTFLERIFNRAVTDHITAYVHNNVPREDDKYVHTDYCKVFFMPHAPCGRLVDTTPESFLTNLLPYAEAPEGSVIEQRALTAIYYLSPDWKPGCGGETGIFARIGGQNICAAKIEPRFNRLLLFENKEYSMHNYMASSLPNRNSIIEWFHEPDQSPGHIPI